MEIKKESVLALDAEFGGIAAEIAELQSIE
jgi:hypothetical protein